MALAQEHHFTGNSMRIKLVSCPPMFAGSQNPLDRQPNRDVTSKAMDQQPELVNKRRPIPMPASIQGDTLHMQPLQRPASNAQLSDSPILSDSANQMEELAIEGGTISISSVYSEGYRMLSLFDASGQRTASVALRNCIYLVPLGFIAYDWGLASGWFCLESTLLTLAISATAFSFYRDQTTKKARRMFHANHELLTT